MSIERDSLQLIILFKNVAVEHNAKLLIVISLNYVVRSLECTNFLFSSNTCG